MNKKFYSSIAWLLAIAMLLTNVNYVRATDASVETEENTLFSEEVDPRLLERADFPQKDKLDHIRNNSSDSTKDNVSDGNDKGTNDGGDIGTGDGADIPTGDHILYAGEFDGLIWYIDTDKVLTITGTNTNNHVTTGDEDDFNFYPWTKYYDDFTKVVITAKNVKSTALWFFYSDIEEVDMSGFDTSTVENMSYMFTWCSNLTSVNMTGLDTSAVKDMSYMFAYCFNVTSLDVSKWNTSAVTNISDLFCSCYDLTSLDVSNWDTSAVEDMSYTFAGCAGLTSLDVSNWNTSAVKIMDSTFFLVPNIENIDVSKWNTSAVEDMSWMFSSCMSLTSLDLSGFDTKNVEYMHYMFEGCEALTTLNVSNFNTSNVYTMYCMFENCSSLTTLDVSSFNLSNFSRTDDMFLGCSSLESINAFRNLQTEIELPYAEMYDTDNNIYEDIFPIGQENSITLLKTAPMDGKMWVTDVEPQTYTGKAIKPAIKVYDGPYLLQEKVDYTVSYKNNVKANDASNTATAPTIIVKGKGNYTGQETVTFKILPVDLNGENIVAKDIYTLESTKEQKPVPTITYKGKKLKKTDFTVSYPSTSADAYKAAGTYTIKVTGTGNYTGEREISLVITNGTLMNKVKVAAIPKQEWTGKAIEPELSVSYKGTPLVQGTDYTVTYSNNINAGKATATIIGMGDYAGTKDVTFQIVGTSIDKFVVTGIVNKVYNGKAQTQNLTVIADGYVLKENEDYDVTYSKNINAGTANIVITGKGKYSGTIKKTFKITPYDIFKDEQNLITGINYSTTADYIKGGVTPEMKIRFNGTKLKIKKDFTVTYSNNKKANIGTSNTGKIIVKGKGNFTGTCTVKLYIYKRELDDTKNPIIVDIPDVPYSPKAGKFTTKPVLTDINGKKLTAGTDYDKNFTYFLEDGTTLDPKKDILPVGTEIYIFIKGKENYQGYIIDSYKITEASFSSAKVTVKPQAYTGKAVTLNPEDVTVTMQGVELKNGVDYEIVEDSYINNVNKGTASVTIRGLGNYGGSKTAKYKITSKQFMWFWNLF